MGLLEGGGEEAARLLGVGEKIKDYGSSYGIGSLPKKGDREKRLEDDEDEVPKVPISALFRYATTRDKWIIGIGTVFAIIHGSGFPLLAMVFGNMTDTFVRQAVYGFTNGTFNSNPNVLNLSTTSSVTSSVRFTTDEILNYASSSNESSSRSIDEPTFGELMNTFTIFYVGIGIIVLISSFIQAICWEWACERQAYRLRQEFFYQVLRQEVSWYDNYQTGDLAIKLSDDLERIREGIGHKFSMVIQFIATFVMGLVIGLITSWQLTLAILSLTPLLAGTTAFSGKMIATQAAREQQKYGKAGGVALEVLSCIRTVASFGGEKREIQRYSLALSAGLKMAIKKYHVFSLAIGSVFFIMYGSYSIAFWYGSQLLSQGKITPGDIFTVFFSVLLGAFSLGNAIPFLTTIGHAQGCGAVVFDIIDTMPTIDAYSRDGIIPDKLTGHIQFRNVGFRYPKRKTVPILKDFNLDIQPGKKVAIVGLSGSGKSTIMNLILRFYDPDLGTILIDGNDLKALNLAWFRYHVGYVAQEPVLFGITIYENIRYGRDDATSEQIFQASKMAYAHDFITALPQGYDTLVGERGSKLSGGQKNRIAIARALVRDPKVLLLDESTSSLDSKSEAVVQAALEQAAKGRTTIIIAHRLSSVIDSDVIYTLNEGKIVEVGKHSQLMSLRGVYHDLVMAQTSVEDLNGYSGASADESAAGEESSKELSLLLAYNQLDSYNRGRKKQRKRFRKKRSVLPDPDRDRLIKEAEELDIESPGIWKILKMNKPEWIMLFMGGLGCAVTGAIMPIFSFFYSQMFTTFTMTSQELLDAAFFWSMMFLVLAATSFIGFWIRTIFVASAGEHLTMRLRLHSFANIVRQPISWFDKDCNSSSRLSTRLARDAPLVKAAAGHRLAIAISSLVTVVAALAIAFYFGWQLALVILAGFPVLMFSGYVQVQVQKSGQKKDAVMMEDAGQCANEAIANIRTVQSLAQERIFCEKYFELLYPIYLEAHRQGLIYGTAFAFSEAVIFLIYAGAFRYGAYLIQVNVMDPESVYRVFFAISFCAVSVGQATSWIPDYTKAKLAAGLMFHLINQKSPIDPFNEGGLRPILKGLINLKEVHFRYPSRPDVPVLRSLTFEVKPGKTLCIMGCSGCGKSTVVSLLERFYDVVSGHVMIDGYDVRSLNTQHLRAHIGVVNQEPVVFDCTIRENIAYGYGDGSTHVPEELILSASRCANIHNFIISLPNGYDTVVGERGAQLSGGQKQRLAIARALIRDPKILLLDEATSALDTENEKIVQEALDKARAGRTCIIIAHRLSTIQNADCIAVMSRGKIVELGTHEELKNAKGMYYRLTKNQQITH